MRRSHHEYFVCVPEIARVNICYERYGFFVMYQLDNFLDKCHLEVLYTFTILTIRTFFMLVINNSKQTIFLLPS